MARPLKPLLLHKVQGTGRAHRMAKRAGELALTPRPVGAPPEFVKAIPEARREWARISGDSEYSQILCPVHRGALAEYCVLFARMVDDSKGARPITASERQTLNSLRMQLGITPASQSKVRAAPAKPVDDEWEKLDRMRNA